MDDFKLIKGTKRFFIHKDGYVFKVENSKDILIELKIIKGVPRVLVENKKLNLVLLMLEYFGNKNNPLFNKYTFKIIDGKIPLNKIKTSSICENSSLDELNIFRYKCTEKAKSQNSRVKNKSTINDIDVLNSLKRTNFKCTYCGTEIKPSKWHLDHFVPLGLNVNNEYKNITPSCKECNLMKGCLSFDKFIFQINLIYKNNLTNNAPLDL